MKGTLTVKQARSMSVFIVVCFLIIHVLLFFFFSYFGVRPMAHFNIFSIVFYALIFFLAEKLGYMFFSTAVFAEVLLHMTAAAIFTGWESGFQITLLGMNILLFYAEYVQRRLKRRYLKSLPLAIANMVCYLLTCVYAHAFPTHYPLPENVCFYLQFAWGIIVFPIMIFFLHLFVNIAADSEEYLSAQIGHDKLTGLPNRYYVSEYLERQKDQGGLLGHWTAMIDIDDFKQINDTYGHNCGDYILVEIARLLRELGEDVMVSRWGGEEFLLMGECSQDQQAVLDRLEALRRRIMDFEFCFEAKRLHLTVTIGYAAYRADYEVTDWVSAADKRLYDGKHRGKNCVVA